MANPAATPERRPPVLNNRDHGIAPFRNTTHQVTLTEEMQLEDVLRPEFWANVNPPSAQRFKPDDIVEIRHVQRLFYAEAYVLDSGPGWLKVKLIHQARLVEDVELPEDSPLKIRWNVGRGLHEVQRKSDEKVISPGHRLKSDAVAWAIDFIAKLK